MEAAKAREEAMTFNKENNLVRERNRMKNTLLWWVVAATIALGGVVVGPSTAFAQDEDESATPTIDGDMDSFWSDVRRVRVLQRRLFEKDGRLQLTLSFGAIPNDPFINYYPLGLRASYYLSESIGLELSGSFMGDVFRSQTDLDTFIEDRYSGQVDVLDQQMWRADFMVLWSPIYGKFSFIGRKLAHFDWNFGAGVGVVGARSILEDRTGEETAINPEAVLGTGWTLWLTEMWAMRLDYRQFIFSKVGGGVTTPSEVSLGVSIFF